MNAVGMPPLPPPALDGGHAPPPSPQRRAHLAKFAFYLSAARSEGSPEPVVGQRHDAEVAGCFSRRHLAPAAFGPRSRVPSISSSSLSVGGGRQPPRGAVPKAAGGGKAAMLEAAARNMAAPHYATPDTASSTAKTILKNVVSSVEELVDSRLRSTISQLLRKAGGTNSQLLCRLLSPSRRPIQIGTVITRFVVPDNDAGANGAVPSYAGPDEPLTVPLLFRAVLDVKIFGEVSTVEISSPVSMSGRFDAVDGLLAAVDIAFDCRALLEALISHARSIVKLAVTKAAALSVQIAEWDSRKKASSLSLTGGKLASLHPTASLLSFRGLLGSTASLGSLNSDVFSSFSSLTDANKRARQQQKAKKDRSPSRLLRALSRNNAALTVLPNGLGGANNANATFDLSGSNLLSNVSALGRFNNLANGPSAPMGRQAASVVRFKIKTPPQSPPADPKPRAPTVHRVSTCLSPSPAPVQQSDKGNIHKGLFSWLENDDMFLTEAKIQEQNAADAERERQRREAPQPLAFFTAAEDMGVGLERVSESIFGGPNKKRRLS